MPKHPFDDDLDLSHEQRIERLVAAALKGGAGRLRFENELARGGMGAVRQAFDATLQRRMAVKTMHAKTYDHVMLVHGFLREAQVTGQLDHPNIVPIHELGRDERGELYFTMKLVDGESLKSMIGGTPPINYDQLKRLLGIFVKVCDALAFAHHRGVLHCDIKSANVMVGKFGQVYLMDWGGAQLLPRPYGVDTSLWVRDSLPALPPSETEGMVFGTPSYMSPEQASAGREPMDERSDVFSMGALLYEMMTGRPPYHGGTPLEGVMRAQIVDIVQPTASHLYPGGELVRIVMRALAKRPVDRFQSVVALQAAIVELLNGSSSFPAVRFKKGEHVIREGEVGDAAYWIEAGSLEVYKLKDGERRSLRVLGPGAIFGETAIFAKSARTASVVALEDVTMQKMTAEVLERELASMSPWMRAAIGTLARRFSGDADDSARARAVAPVGPAAVTPAAATSVPTVTERVPTAMTVESVLVDIDDLGVPDADSVLSADELVDDEDDPTDDINTRLIGPWTRKPPPRSDA